MNHLEFTRDNIRYSLTGQVISFFNENGLALKRWFYADIQSARKAFFMLANCK